MANNGYVIGYCATWDVDSQKDMIKKGAFSEFVKEFNNRPREERILPFLFNHKSGDLYSYIGRVVWLQEDDYGLQFEADLDDTPEAQRVREMLTDHRLSKFSFAFDILDSGKIRKNGEQIRELRKLNVHEISVCLFPANRRTMTLEAKAQRDEKIKRLLKEAKQILGKR